MPVEDFNYDHIIAKFKEELHLVVTLEDITSESYEELEEKLISIIKEVYEKKMSVAAPEQKSEIERIILTDFR